MSALKNFDFVHACTSGEFITANITVEVTNDGGLELHIAADGDLDDGDILEIAQVATSQRLRMTLAGDNKIIFTPKNGNIREIAHG